MKNKRFVYAVVIVAALLGVIAIIAAQGMSTNNNKAKKIRIGQSHACNILNLSLAHGLLGPTTLRGSQKENTFNGTTKDLDVSTCMYQQLGANPTNDLLIARVSVKAPLNKAVTELTIKEFSSMKGKSSIYGDASFWDAKAGTFNVLKRGRWYVLIYGPSQAQKRSDSQTRELANSLIDKY